ncbi:hypothetical protein quinque_005505 [Culex quinquefasciatus]
MVLLRCRCVAFGRTQCRRLSSSAVSYSARRVVITGLGVVSPVGCSVAKAWTTILSGTSAIGRLEGSGYEKLPCRVAGQIRGDELDVGDHFGKSELKTMARATALALIAAKEALDGAKWTPEDVDSCQRTGVAIGMGMIDLMDVCRNGRSLEEGLQPASSTGSEVRIIRFRRRVPPGLIRSGMRSGLSGTAMQNVMVCGRAEASISPLGIAGFCRLRALSTSFNEEPQKSSRPFDAAREGFVMGEGSAILVLEELEHAKARGADIAGEILGYGLSGDASHLTAPREDGTGAMLAMSRALKDAHLSPKDIGYVNAHATSTPIGDAIEARSIRTLFNGTSERVAVSSTKGAHGHLLGAAGNLEALFTVLACLKGKLPPTINLETIPEEMQDMNLVPNEAQDWNPSSGRRIALKNSFGFGGTNACLCIAEYKE